MVVHARHETEGGILMELYLNRKSVHETRETYDEFSEMLRNIEELDKWEDLNEGDLFLSVLPEGSAVPEGRIESKDFVSASDAQVNELCCEGGFVLFDGKRSFIPHPTGISTIIDRAGIKGRLSAALLEEDVKEPLASLINIGLSHYKDSKVKLLMRGGYAMAVHGSQYAEMSQCEGFEIVDEALSERFPNKKFAGGTFTFEETSASYSLGDYSDEIMRAYKKAWEKAGMPTAKLKRIQPCITVNTSDVGEACFEIIPMLQMGAGRMNPLGPAMKVKHRGNNSVGMLKRCIENTFSALSDALDKKLPALMDITLDYPQPALVRALDKLGICKGGSKSMAELLVRSFERRFDTYSMVKDSAGNLVADPDRDILTAFDLYCFISDMQYYPEFKNLAEQTKERLIESIYRIPNLDWRDLDEDGPMSIH